MTTTPYAAVPDATGHFGPYGGRFVPEALVAAIDELTAAFHETQTDPAFVAEFRRLLRDYTGRPSPLTDAARFGAHAGGARILLKREDLNHTGSHKINNVLGQALLTQRIGKKRVIAETGAGQHGVATATAAALMGLECVVYMGEEDTRRQALNVVRMQLLGAEVVPVTTGSRTLKDAINEAMRDWVTNVETTNYVFGTVAGPHPFPLMVREFQRVIGDEARAQVLERVGRLPDVVAACVGGGSNAIGIFTAFVPDADVRLVGFEAGGDGVETGRHAATITGGAPGVLHGARSYLLQDENGQTIESHSISAGLDYPGVGPEHSYLHDIGRAEYRPITDAQAMAAFSLLCRTEGIIPAIESAHALAGALDLGRELGPGRGHPRQPVRPRRQGRRDGVDVLRPAPRAVRVTALADAVRGGAGREPGGADRLPAGRLPDRGRLDRRDARDGRGRSRHRRGRRPVQRPGDGRADDPGRRRAGGASGRRPARRAARGGAVVRRRCRRRRDDVLEPDRALRRRAVRRRSRRRRRVGAITPDLIPDEAAAVAGGSPTPHGLDRVFLVAPSSTDARIASTAAASRGFVYAASTMGVTGRADSVEWRGRGAGERGCAGWPRTCRCASASASPTVTRRPRSRPSPTG